MTILNQYEILENVTPIWWIIGFVALLICIIGIISFIPTSQNPIAPILCWILIAALFLGIIWVSVVYEIVHKEDVPTGRYRYECIIDDDTSFADILEDYVVVEQRGDLWILEDK